jgi:multidrug efflux pump
MIVSDTSIKRPVLTIVGALILMLLGILSFRNLPVREYPDTDVPTVSVTTIYRGASAAVVESRITEPPEEQLSAIDGIRVLKSSSAEEVSRLTIDFNLDREAAEAANDVRDRVARVKAQLPRTALDPVVSKIEADAWPIMWIALMSDRHTPMELTDYADRYLTDPLKALPGVATVVIGGERKYSMRVWLDRERLGDPPAMALPLLDHLLQEPNSLDQRLAGRSVGTSGCHT